MVLKTFLCVNYCPFTVPKLVGIMIVQHPTVGVIPSKSVTIMQLLFVRFISRTRIVPSIIYVIVLSVAPSQPC